MCIHFRNYNYFGYLKGVNEVNRQCFQQAVLLCLLKHCIMLEYAPMLHVSYYAQNYADIIHQGLAKFEHLLHKLQYIYHGFSEVW